ncbi:MAG: DAK2 domain-containing protein [Burkholderiales bacterium]
MNDVLSVADIAGAVRRIHARIGGLRDELDAADRAMGDGDTGKTVADVVEAWQAALVDEHADACAFLKALGAQTRRATGSSLGSVMGIGLSAAGRSGATSAVDMLDAAIAAITERSGASAGDKTILDSLIAIRESLARGEDPVAGAQRALDAFRMREAKIGRARVYGARSAGHDDPGMLAALLMLRAASS